MHYLRIAFLGVLLLPNIAFGAGFAKQSLFLSKTPVVEGESVLIHTVVQNDGTTAFNGSLVVFAEPNGGEKEKVGTVAVAIAPEGANTVSVSWKPASGEYTVVAELTGQSGTVVETQSARFTINKKPAAAQTNELLDQADAPVQSSADVQAMIAKFSPSVAGITEPAFLAIDSLRAKTGGVLDQGITWSKSKVGAKNPGEVLGESAKDTSPQGILGTALYLAAIATLYAFSILKWIVANAGIFYPVLAIAFLYTLWRIFARMRRPRY
jgi:hypothetical protein